MGIGMPMSQSRMPFMCELLHVLGRNNRSGASVPPPVKVHASPTGAIDKPQIS
jgi:hypothetical protein